MYTIDYCTRRCYVSVLHIIDKMKTHFTQCHFTAWNMSREYQLIQKHCGHRIVVTDANECIDE